MVNFLHLILLTLPMSSNMFLFPLELGILPQVFDVVMYCAIETEMNALSKASACIKIWKKIILDNGFNINTLVVHILNGSEFEMELLQSFDSNRDSPDSDVSLDSVQDTYLGNSKNYLLAIGIEANGVQLFQAPISALSIIRGKTILLQRFCAIQNISYSIPISLEIPLSPEELYRNLHLCSNLQNVSLKAVGELFTLNSNFLNAKTVNGRYTFTGGFMLEIATFLAEALNFTVLPVKSKGYIGMTPNGEFTGMGAQLLSGEADIGIMASEYIPYRLTKLAFTFPVYASPITAYLARKPSNNLRDIYYNAFEPPIWLCFLLLSITIATVVHLFVKMKQMYSPDSSHTDVNDVIMMKENFTFAVGSICLQGWHICPKSISLRVVLLVTQITSLVGFAAFTAILVSTLSLDKDLIQTPSDLSKFHYSVYSDEVEHATEYFVHILEKKSVDDPSLQNRSISLDQAFNLIHSSPNPVAMISIPDTFYPLLREHHKKADTSTSARLDLIDPQICKDISDVKVSDRPLLAGLFIRKDSRESLMPYLNQKIIIMIERGLRSRYMTNFFKNSTVHCGSSTSYLPQVGRRKSMGLTDVWSAFAILCVTLIPVLCLLLGEKLIHKLSK